MQKTSSSTKFKVWLIVSGFSVTCSPEVTLELDLIGKSSQLFEDMTEDLIVQKAFGSGINLLLLKNKKGK